jgi:hypothetical protein
MGDSRLTTEKGSGGGDVDWDKDPYEDDFDDDEFDEGDEW